MNNLATETTTPFLECGYLCWMDVNIFEPWRVKGEGACQMQFKYKTAMPPPKKVEGQMAIKKARIVGEETGGNKNANLGRKKTVKLMGAKKAHKFGNTK
jgi:hypothetical protein